MAAFHPHKPVHRLRSTASLQSLSPSWLARPRAHLSRRSSHWPSPSSTSYKIWDGGRALCCPCMAAALPHFRGSRHTVTNDRAHTRRLPAIASSEPGSVSNSTKAFFFFRWRQDPVARPQHWQLFSSVTSSYHRVASTQPGQGLAQLEVSTNP